MPHEHSSAQRLRAALAADGAGREGPGRDGPYRDTAQVAALLRRLEVGGALRLPLPRTGATRERWAALTELGRTDLVLARLGEAHTDAGAILAEAGRGPVPGALYGVWASASGGSGLAAAPADGGGFALAGRMRFCSGAQVLDRALVTARAPDGLRLFDLDLADPGVTPVEGTWAAVGLAESASLDVLVEDAGPAAADPVGPPGWYLSRPGFWVGGIGVAACWLGGAVALVETLHATLHPSGHPGGHPSEPSPHQLAHLGACVAEVQAVQAALDAGGREVDSRPDADHQRLALSIRHLSERACEQVLRRVGRATGAVPLTHDRAHAQRVADLHVYVRQQHAERDLEQLGRYALDDLWGDG